MSRFVDVPTDEHRVAAGNVFLYLLGTKETGIIIGVGTSRSRMPNCNFKRISAYRNSKWARYIVTRKCT